MSTTFVPDCRRCVIKGVYLRHILVQSFLPKLEMFLKIVVYVTWYHFSSCLQFSECDLSIKCLCSYAKVILTSMLSKLGGFSGFLLLFVLTRRLLVTFISEGEIWPIVFFAYSPKNRRPEKIHFFLPEKFKTVIFYWRRLSPRPIAKMIKKLTFDNLFRSQQPSR